MTRAQTVKWTAVCGAYLSRDEGDHLCITLRPAHPDCSKAFGFMADAKTLRSIGEGLLALVEQLEKRNQKESP